MPDIFKEGVFNLLNCTEGIICITPPNLLFSSGAGYAVVDLHI
jgi:hypothetical protein